MPSFANQTNVSSSANSTTSVSDRTSIRNNTSAATASGYDPAGNVGYGVGRLLRGAFDLASSAWQSWWNPGPSEAEIAHQRQVMIYRQGLEECVKHLDRAMDNLRKNPKDPQSLKRIETLASHYAEYVQPAPTDALKRYQQNLFQSIAEKMGKLPSHDLKRRLSELLPIVSLKEGVLTDTKEKPSLPFEATSMTDTSNSHRAIEDALDAKRKRSVTAQPAPGFPAVFDLRTLDGKNGFTVTGDRFDDGYTVVGPAGDINADGIADLVICAPGDHSGGICYIIYGQETKFPALFDVGTTSNGINGFAVASLYPEDRLGSFVTTAGDLNGDGIDDLVIGAESYNKQAGAAFIIHGRKTRFPARLYLGQLNGTNGFAVLGQQGDRLGVSGSPAGDLNGDHIDDLVLGARGTPTHIKPGTCYVVFGNKTGFPESFNVNGLDGSNGFAIQGLHPGDQLGVSVTSVRDINGDGRNDLLLGAYNGKGYVIYGQPNYPANFSLATLDGITNGFAISAPNGSDELNSVAAGDINGDGLSDIIICVTTTNNQTGSCYVIYGQRSFPAHVNLSTVNGTNGFVIPGVQPSGWLGASVGAADINGDNKTDLILGSRYAGVYVILASSKGFPASINLSQLDGKNGFTIPSIYPTENLGNSVSRAGDINDDGIDDIVLGSESGTSSHGYFISGKSLLTLINNQITIRQGKPVVLTSDNLRAEDLNFPAGSLSINMSGLFGGQFEFLDQPGVPISAFRQQSIFDQKIQFVQDGSKSAGYKVSVRDGNNLSTRATSANVTFLEDNPKDINIDLIVGCTVGLVAIATMGFFAYNYKSYKEEEKRLYENDHNLSLSERQSYGERRESSNQKFSWGCQLF